MRLGTSLFKATCVHLRYDSVMAPVLLRQWMGTKGLTVWLLLQLFHLAPQIEHFLIPLDLFHISIWQRACRKRFKMGRPIHKTCQAIGLTLCLSHSKQTSLFFFFLYCQLNLVATAQGFPWMKGTTLDVHHSSVSSSNAPWHLAKLLSVPVRSKATCDMEATWKCFLYFSFIFSGVS